MAAIGESSDRYIIRNTYGFGQSRRPRSVKTPEGLSRRNFFILSTVPDPLRCLDMSKHSKTIRLTSPAMQQVRAGRYLLRFKAISGWVRFYRDERPGVLFQYLYCLLWRIPIVKWNSLERVVLNSTGRDDQAFKFRFYVTFLFTSGWRGLTPSRHFLR